MRIFLILLLLSFRIIAVYAQKQTAPIIRDTINLRGYVYQSDGKPVKHFMVTSSYSQTEYTNDSYPKANIRTLTDTNGYFELHGAKPYDTLTMDQPLFYGAQQYYNKGSRYMVIYLPPLKVVDITADKPIVVTRKRMHQKAQAIYHPKPFIGNVDFFDVHELPSYKGTGVNYHKDQYQIFTDSLRARINYPAKAIANDIEGTVKISCTVESDGRLIFKVLQGIGYGCDEEVINAIRHLPGWRPAINNGRLITVEQTVTVEFKLTDK